MHSATIAALHFPTNTRALARSRQKSLASAISSNARAPPRSINARPRFSFFPQSSAPRERATFVPSIAPAQNSYYITRLHPHCHIHTITNRDLTLKSPGGSLYTHARAVIFEVSLNLAHVWRSLALSLSLSPVRERESHAPPHHAGRAPSRGAEAPGDEPPQYVRVRRECRARCRQHNTSLVHIIHPRTNSHPA